MSHAHTARSRIIGKDIAHGVSSVTTSGRREPLVVSMLALLALDSQDALECQIRERWKAIRYLDELVP